MRLRRYKQLFFIKLFFSYILRVILPRNFLQDSKSDHNAKLIKDSKSHLIVCTTLESTMTLIALLVRHTTPLYYNYQCEMSAPRSVVSPRHHFVDPLTARRYESLRIILCKSQAALMLARPYIEEGASYMSIASQVTQRKGCVDDGSGFARTRGESTGLI